MPYPAVLGEEQRDQYPDNDTCYQASCRFFTGDGQRGHSEGKRATTDLPTAKGGGSM